MRLPLFTAFSFSDTFDKSGTAYFFRTGCVNLPESNLKKICFYVVHNLFRLFFFEICRKMPILKPMLKIDANRFVNMTICKIVLHYMKMVRITFKENTSCAHRRICLVKNQIKSSFFIGSRFSFTAQRFLYSRPIPPSFMSLKCRI